VVLLPARPSSARAGTPPNVVVIVTDDQRAGTVRWMPTVHRELARLGTSFTNAYVPTPTCCPSRASLFTGLFATRTGVWANGGSSGGLPIGGWPAFAAGGNEARTVATWLTPTHRTILVGKYMNDYDDAGAGHVPRGWDRWHAFFMRNAAYYDYRLVDGRGRITRYGDRREDYSTDVLAELAVDEIDDAPSNRPLMLFFTPYAPHGPTIPAPRHEGLGTDLPRYDAPNVNERNVNDKPDWIQDLSRTRPRRIAKTRADAYASLQAVDDAVGRILDALRRNGRLRDSLIVFVSDNGSSWAEHRLPIGDKFVPYDAQMRVPLIVRWDGVVAAGRRDDRLSAVADIPPTIARAVGFAIDGLDGRSLLGRPRRGGLPLAASQAFGRSGDGISLDRPAYCGYRTDRYSYVRYADGTEELYDLRNDRYELRNRAGTSRFRDAQDRLRSLTDASCVPLPPGF
jgi:arylsulfatase A-like enzyme